jgi:tRNA 2-selenouridine synthase
LHNISATSFAEIFLKDTPIIDVRAPVEFAQGSLPGAVNLPIMNNDERAAVGTTYKQTGREQAMALGHELVSGEVREERLQKWADHIKQHPEAVIYCFRGGLRSQITQRWLAERGVHRPLIMGGYKAVRHFLREQIDTFSQQNNLLILSGPTGSAKTHLLKQSQNSYPNLDLEGLARHRGSAFGSYAVAQPSQIDFENAIAVKLLKVAPHLASGKILIEDESRLIGRCAVPESLFFKMRESELIYLEESFEQRVENIFQDYVQQTAIGEGSLEKGCSQFADYKNAISQISRKLGGARAQELLQDLSNSENDFLKDSKTLESNKIWISKLLTYYYDPIYANSLAKRSPKILMRGNAAAVLEYLQALQPST